MRKKEVLTAVFVTGAAALVGTQANAATTPVSDTSFIPSEPDHQTILETVYGVDLTGSPETGFFSDELIFERIDDDSGEEQVFASGAYDFEALGQFARKTQYFGYLPGESGGDYQNLTKVKGDGFDITEGSGSFSVDGPFRFARVSGLLSVDPQLMSSLATDNPDDHDQLVTYRLISPTGEDTLILFWEDIFGRYADDDYQDLVIRVTRTGDAFVIPTPAAFGAGLAMLGGLMVRRRQG